jgi:hypothetical protein
MYETLTCTGFLTFQLFDFSTFDILYWRLNLLGSPGLSKERFDQVETPVLHLK